VIASSFCSTDFSCIFKWRTSLSSLLSVHDVMVIMTKNVIAKHKYPSRNRSLSSKALMFCYGKYFIATIARPIIPTNRIVNELVRLISSVSNFKSKDLLRCLISLRKELISSLIARLSATFIKLPLSNYLMKTTWSKNVIRMTVKPTAPVNITPTLELKLLKASSRCFFVAKPLVTCMRNPFVKSSPYPKYRPLARVYQ